MDKPRKKLLLLGGSRYILPIIKACHDLKYKAFTCDYLPHNVAHKYSDGYYNVSIVEQDKVLELARQLNVDGVMSFACDPGVTTAAYVSEAMGLPTCPYQSVALLQNKAAFRDFLTRNHFNVPRAKGYRTLQEALVGWESFQGPVMVKPVDSAGSKGVSRVSSRDDLPRAVKNALDHSISKNFILEEVIDAQGCSSDTDCFSVNGKLVFASFSNQYFDPTAQNPYTPSGYSWPSAMPPQTQQDLRAELQRLLNLLGMTTSIYNVETRLGTDGKPYIMECSPRGGGNRLAEILQMATGTDLITNAVRAAVGEPIQGIHHDPEYHGNWAEIILHAEQDGIFQGLHIAPELRSHVVQEDLWIKPGAPVHGFTGANEAIGTLVLNLDSPEQCDQVLRHSAEVVTVKTH